MREIFLCRFLCRTLLKINNKELHKIISGNKWVKVDMSPAINGLYNHYMSSDDKISMYIREYDGFTTIKSSFYMSSLTIGIKNKTSNYPGYLGYYTIYENIPFFNLVNVFPNNFFQSYVDLKLNSRKSKLSRI